MGNAGVFHPTLRLPDQPASFPGFLDDSGGEVTSRRSRLRISRQLFTGNSLHLTAGPVMLAPYLTKGGRSYMAKKKAKKKTSSAKKRRKGKKFGDFGPRQ